MRVVFAVLTLAVCCIFTAPVVLPLSADEPKPQALKATDVLDRMAKAYADCKSYRDSGVVKTVYIQAEVKRTVMNPFTTAFVRPDRFRFEFKAKRGEGDNEENRYIVWRKGMEVQTWWDLEPGVKKRESLGSALAGAVGVSGGSAHTIPALLLKGKGRRLIDTMEAKRVGNAKLDKMDCFRIKGKSGDTPTTLWIDQKTFLVRRIDAQNKFDNFRTEVTTTYDPVVDEEIPDKKLEFDPRSRSEAEPCAAPDPARMSAFSGS